MKPGTQIIYVPTYANGDIDHSDCEKGFVVRVTKNGEIALCRYWSNYSPGELRTKANNELTPTDLLVIRDTVPQQQVKVAMKLCGIVIRE